MKTMSLFPSGAGSLYASSQRPVSSLNQMKPAAPSFPFSRGIVISTSEENLCCPEAREKS